MTYVSNLNEAVEFINSEFERLQTKISNFENETPKQPEFKPYDCPELKQLRQKFSYRNETANLLSGRNAKWEYDNALALIQKANDYFVEISKDNDIIIENNKKIIQKIKQMMSVYGIPEKRRVLDKKSRAQYPKYVTETCGWVTDLNTFVKTVDGRKKAFDELAGIKRLVETVYKESEDARQKEKEETERMIKQKETEKAQRVYLVKMIKHYDLDPSSTIYDVYNFFLSKNKYLELAEYLLMNRLDWNDGTYYAEKGLSKFKVETDLDKEIVYSIGAVIEDWEGDGRVFRDCEWCYDRLYQLVKKENPEMIEHFIEGLNLFDFRTL